MTGPSNPGYLRQLEQAARTTGYLRVFFSVALLGYAAFGPGLLIRFPFFLEGARANAIAWFHGFRPALYALIFILLVAVLGALARRAWSLFEEFLRAAALEPDARAAAIRHLKPGEMPFMLSGNQPVDTVVFIIILLAYSFWAFLLVEAVPAAMGSPQVIGVVLGTYGLLGGLIIAVAVWAGLARRSRRLQDAAGG